MIHCIGNSHINTYSNETSLKYQGVSNEIFIGHWLGPTIAYNFFEHHLARVFQEIQNINKNDYITLIVGEVDCRFHLPKQADIQGRDDRDVVAECAERFFRCYDFLAHKGFRVMVTGTHPTTIGKHNDDPDNPVWGDVQRRNKICVMWNLAMQSRAQSRSIPFVSIYNYLVDENNITKMKYFLDYCHLNSSKVFPFIIQELKKVGMLQ